MVDPPAHRRSNPKDAHLERLDAELDRWETEKNELAEAVRSGEPTARDAGDELQELQSSYETARAVLFDAKQSPAKQWVTMKEKADDAMGAVREAVQRARLSVRGRTGNP